MLFSEIKSFLSSLNESDLAIVKEAYERCNKSLVCIVENVDEPSELIIAILQVANNADEFCELIK